MVFPSESTAVSGTVNDFISVPTFDASKTASRETMRSTKVFAPFTETTSSLNWSMFGSVSSPSIFAMTGVTGFSAVTRSSIDTVIFGMLTFSIETSSGADI